MPVNIVDLPDHEQTTQCLVLKTMTFLNSADFPTTARVGRELPSSTLTFFPKGDREPIAFGFLLLETHQDPLRAQISPPSDSLASDAIVSNDGSSWLAHKPNQPFKLSRPLGRMHPFMPSGLADSTEQEDMIEPVDFRKLP